MGFKGVPMKIRVDARDIASFLILAGFILFVVTYFSSCAWGPLPETKVYEVTHSPKDPHPSPIDVSREIDETK